MNTDPQCHNERSRPGRSIARRALAVLVPLTVALAAAAGGSDVALRVADETVTLDMFEQKVADRVPADADPAARDSLLMAAANSLVDKMVLAVEARTHVRGDTSGLGAELAGVRRDELLSVYRDDVLHDVHVSPEEADRVFGWLGEEVRIRQILCASPTEANAVLRSLERGADFAELAASQSRDAWTRTDGGLMGWFTYGVYEGLDDAAFPLAVGEIAGPVWTQRGWHIIRLEARRPRERTEGDFGGEDFAADVETRRRDIAWRAHLARVWLDTRAAWAPSGLDRLAERLLRHRGVADSLTRIAQSKRAEGEDVSAIIESIPDAPDVSPLTAQEPLVRSSDGVVLDIGEAIEIFRDMTPAKRPVSLEAAMLRVWLEPFAAERVALEHARQSGFADRADVREAIANAVDFHLVQRLYDHEIEQGVQPTDEDVRGYYDAHASSFTWRPDLDLAVFRSRETPIIKQIRDRLVSGLPFEEIRREFAPRDTSLIAYRTGMKRTFPEVNGMDRIARALDDERGAVSLASSDGERVTIVRIEDVGESSQMTFADAFELAEKSCTVEMRERRLRSLLDSLRVAYDAHIDESVVRRAGATEGGS